MLQNFRVESGGILQNLRTHAQVHLDCKHYSDVGEVAAWVGLF